MKGSVIDDRLFEILREHDFDGVGMGDTIRRIKEVFGHEELPCLEIRKNQFKEDCKVLLKEDRSNAKMLGDFYLYYTEHKIPVRANTKMKFETFKTFNLKLRYATWEKRSKTFSIVNQLKKGR